MRQLLTVVGLAVVAGIPRIVAAQSTEAPLPPVVEPAPPVVPPGPPALDDRPMRFLLSTGAVVIGTRIGESPTAIGVRTATGIITIYKSQVVTMDYRVELGRDFGLRTRQGPVPIARPAPPVPERFTPATARERAPRRHPGRGARIAGGIVFGLSYGVSALGALVAMSSSQEGMLLLIPVAGPLVWGLTDMDRRMEIGLLLTVVQGIGAGLLTYGIVAGHDAQGETGRRFLAVTPVVTPDLSGVFVSGTL